MNKIEKISVEDKLESAFLEYSVSVIAGRTVPDVRDGLKPVHRRIIYSLVGLDALSDGRYKKSARIVGDVIGKYHPHGDTSVYDAMVRMAQDFSMMLPLVDGQGNFGSIDGDSAAAMRYTEAKGTKYLSELVSLINKNTVEFVPNYDGSLTEPSVLPSLVPNLIINGTSGIAVGMTTSIPPHNPSEVLSACLAVLDNPKIGTADLLNIIKGPDFPTGGIIYSDKGFFDIYDKGHGTFKICSEFKIENSCIIINSIPYGIRKNDIISKISELMATGKIIGITRVVDESSAKNGIKIVIESNKKVDLEKIRNILIKSTSLETSFSCNFLAVKDKQPKIYNLKELISEYLEYQYIVLLRSSNFELSNLQQKKERLDALIAVLGDIDLAISVIRNSEDTKSAILNIENSFNLSHTQAKYILEVKLQRLVKQEVDALRKELSQVNSMISKLEILIGNKKVQTKELAKAISRLIKEYGRERKTQIVEKSFNSEVKKTISVIQELPTVVFLTQEGLLKRGASVSAVKGNSDFFINKIECNTHSLIGCVSQNGVFFTLEAYKIPECSKNTPSFPFSKFLNLKSDKIIDIFLLSENEEFLYLFTKNGMLKKTHISEYTKTGPSGVKGIKLNEDDSVEFVACGNSDGIAICTSSGNVFYYPDDITPTGRPSKGVVCAKLKGGEFVTDVSAIETKDKLLFCIDDKGIVNNILFSDIERRNKLSKVNKIQNPVILKIVDKNKVSNLVYETSAIGIDFNAAENLPIETKGLIKLVQYV